MGNRRNRYSSSLAPDWIVSPPRTEKVAAVENSAEKHTACRVPSYEPSNVYQGLDSEQNPPKADDARKRARYKKSLPSDWVASDSEDNEAIENQHLQPLRGLSRSTYPDIELYDASVRPMPGRLQSTNRCATLASNIHTLIPPERGSEFVPPPAPTQDIKMFLPKSVHEQQVRSVFRNGSFLYS